MVAARFLSDCIIRFELEHLNDLFIRPQFDKCAIHCIGIISCFAFALRRFCRIDIRQRHADFATLTRLEAVDLPPHTIRRKPDRDRVCFDKGPIDDLTRRTDKLRYPCASADIGIIQRFIPSALKLQYLR